MEKILKNYKDFIYEKVSSFNNLGLPSYNLETGFGYVVFFIASNNQNLIDYGVFNKKRELITFVDNINHVIASKKSKQSLLTELLELIIIFSIYSSYKGKTKSHENSKSFHLFNVSTIVCVQ